jgi:hypothetical protein
MSVNEDLGKLVNESKIIIGVRAHWTQPFQFIWHQEGSHASEVGLIV